MKKWHVAFIILLAAAAMLQSAVIYKILEKLVDLDGRIIELEMEFDRRQTLAIQMCIIRKNPSLSLVQVLNYSEAILASSKSHNLDPLLVTSVTKIESGFKATAVSRANARGLMQLMDKTFKEVCPEGGNVFDYADNIEAGTRYLKKLLYRFGGDLRLALAAYNCGPSRSADRILEISGQYADDVIKGWIALRAEMLQRQEAPLVARYHNKNRVNKLRVITLYWDDKRLRRLS
ncbi:MAG: lytic transglycosylase domain-containing protein [Bacteroidota bacterium]